eukprot:COSAG06_NODE_1772_length_8428_cov_8.827710_4_plen_50_part_00
MLPAGCVPSLTKVPFRDQLSVQLIIATRPDRKQTHSGTISQLIIILVHP